MDELALAKDDLSAAQTPDTPLNLGMWALLGAGLVVLVMMFKKNKQEG